MQAEAAEDKVTKTVDNQPLSTLTPSTLESEAAARSDFEAAKVRGLMLVLAMLLGAYVRLAPVFATDFPLNDGGLFYLMCRELIANDWRLPAVTAYNEAQIPFAYPPLGFYFASSLATVSGWPLLDIVRVLPALWSIATIPAFAWLARGLCKENSWVPVVATCAFALLPRGFEVCIIGGGLTRAPGFVFVLLALGALVRLMQDAKTRWLIAATLFATLTVLTHPTVSWLLVYSTFVLLLFYGRFTGAPIKVLGQVFGVVAGAALLSAPWWFTVLSQHGVAPFVAAFGTKQYAAPWLPLVFWDFTGEPLLEIGAVLSWLGLFVCWAQRKYLIPLWLLAMFVLQPRGVAVYATVPLAILVALSLCELIAPSFKRWNEELARPRPMLLVMSVALVLYGLFGAFMASMRLTQQQTLSRDERQALSWIEQQTPKDARFLVLTGQDVWQDPTSEWFPVLTQRVSVATVQGYEWLPQSHNQRWQQFEALQKCLGEEAACLTQWSRATQTTYNYLYLRRVADEPLQTNAVRQFERTLRDAKYQLLYDGRGASVWRR
jgi:hypothetical protein